MEYNYTPAPQLINRLIEAGVGHRLSMYKPNAKP